MAGREGQSSHPWRDRGYQPDFAPARLQIPGLYDPDFLASLERRKQAAEGKAPKDPAQLDRLKGELIKISSLAPRPRGYAFEKFLNELFEAHGLAPRGPFRLKGEQIDGSFQHDAQTYLLEAKWHNEPIGRAPLSVLNDTVNSMARWSRGLFVSYSGFTLDGIAAFNSGRPTALIAMDGLDLYEVLDRNLSLRDVLTAKSRRAAESNQCFVPVRLLL